jgi:hypothetical protein
MSFVNAFRSRPFHAELLGALGRQARQDPFANQYRFALASEPRPANAQPVALLQSGAHGVRSPPCLHPLYTRMRLVCLREKTVLVDGLNSSRIYCCHKLAAVYFPAESTLRQRIRMSLRRWYVDRLDGSTHERP